VTAMVSSDRAAPIPDDSDGGVLLAEGNIAAAELYDPGTGKALLVLGVPLDPPPPAPDQVRSGIIDSGVLADHPQLRNLVVAQKDFTGDDPVDRVGHGTLVALRLLESHHGNLKKLMTEDPELAAKLVDSPALVYLKKRMTEDPGLPAKLARSPALVSAKVTGPTGKIELEHVIEAVHWIATQGVRVVNMSLGFLGKQERYVQLCEAIAQYRTQPNNGILFSAAAGNFGPNVSVYPAACDKVLSVGGTIDGQRWAQSGSGKAYAEARMGVFPAFMYYYEGAQEAARAGDNGRAREGYGASLAAEENAPALFGLAVLDLHAGELDSAYNGLTRAAQLSPNDPEIEAHLGAARLMQERPAEARGHLDRALALNPNNVRARINRSIVLVQLGETALAFDDLVAARSIADDKSRIDAMILDLVRKLGLPLPPWIKS
jgi:subtilisin family serine protease